MRLLLGIGFVAVCAVCQADHLIHIPLGKKVPRKVIRVSAGLAQGDLHDMHGMVDVGLTTELDATLRTDDVKGSIGRATLDFAYNYISPIVDTSPGFSVGVWDAVNRTVDGRRLYVATTYRVGLSGEAGTFTPAEVTLGITVGKKNSGIVGAMLPISSSFRLMVEHDGYRGNAGIDMRPWSNFSVRYVFIGSLPEFAVQFQKKL